MVSFRKIQEYEHVDRGTSDGRTRVVYYEAGPYTIRVQVNGWTSDGKHLTILISETHDANGWYIPSIEICGGTDRSDVNGYDNVYVPTRVQIVMPQISKIGVEECGRLHEAIDAAYGCAKAIEDTFLKWVSGREIDLSVLDSPVFDPNI